MVIQGDYKLIIYPSIGKTLLFNHRADPLEKEDLAGDPEQVSRIGSMMAMLERLQRETGDTLSLSRH
jgi:hypothetical protein